MWVTALEEMAFKWIPEGGSGESGQAKHRRGGQLQVQEKKVCPGPQGAELLQLRGPGVQRATNPA